jgi:hypothetical protein
VRVSTHSWSDRNKSGYDATVRICKDCNTNILNNCIEKPFQVNLKSMVEGDAVTLDSDAVTRMATWAAKTVMTRELLDKGMGDLSIPEWQYRWLHDYVSPPQTMLMYFGKAEYAPDKWDRHRRFRAVVDGEHLGGIEGFITSFVIGHFWFILAGFADEDIFDAFKDSIDEFYT